ncbi:SIR2 family protein [Pontibacter sp. Tf4]|uniref:SIR2 family protein n=1 Tax=Pontibacter sp. Tf4 TaxID=2761620 RepID=UPI00162A80D0|nr:SIR2 family protein [Pontibacter sp. Tf4]MBB6610485.1 SIR2 family protein [Pontibacter sp. Tf4]
MKSEHELFVKDYLKKLNNGSAAIFAGAGLSVGAGFINWKELLNDIATELKLNIELEYDLISLAQYHVNEKRNSSFLNKRIVEEFAERAEPTENHRILARLPISTYWTTNYDNLIEQTLRDYQKIVDTKHTPSQLTTHRNRRDAVVYKMHGDVDHATNAVLTKDHYERYYKTHAPFITALSADLVTKTFLFIGFSFSDPNISYVLSRLKVGLDDETGHHYAFIKKVARGDKGSESKEDFLYNQRKQYFMLEDLKRYGINAVEVDSYDEITEILIAIERRYKQQTVFIAGSAEEYGEWGKDKALTFIHSLSKSLVGKNYKVVNGFGWGVGSAVINGALEMIYEKPLIHTEEQLLIRPFPQVKTGKYELGKLWQQYRERMISFAGVALFVFGNKMENGSIIDAGGVRKEFEIAQKQGVVLLPIGATGYMSKALWEEVMQDFDTFYPNLPEVRKLVEQLGNSEPEQIIKIILQILSIINKK